MAVALDAIQTVAQFQAASFAASTLTFDIPGYLTQGVGGLSVRRVGSEPGHPWKFRSSDRFLPNGSIDNTNGGWWEGYPVGQNFVSVMQFGAVADGVTDNLSVFNNAIAYLDANYQAISFYMCDYSLFIPAGKYYLSNTWDLGVRGKRIFGDQPTLLSTIKTELLFPENTVGLLAGHHSGFASLQLEYFTIVAQRAGKAFNNLAHGIQCQVPIIANYVEVSVFNGNGWHLCGSTDGANPWGQVGFVDLSCLVGCTGDSNGANGFYCFGADANVMYFQQCSATGNIMYGFRDDGFLGNVYQSCHASANGRGWEGGKSDIWSQCNYAGNQWTPVPVYENFNLTLPSTTTPGTDETVWRCVEEGTDPAHYPTWTNGADFQAGGSYCGTSLSRFIACYSEQGSGYAWVSGPKLFPTWVEAWGVGLPASEPKYSMEPTLQIVNPHKPGTTTMEDITLKFCRQINGANGNDIIMSVGGSVSGEFDMQLVKSTGNLAWTPLTWPNAAMEITGINTTYQYGSGSAQPGVLGVKAVGFNGNIIIDSGTSAPAGGARGWARINEQPRTETAISWNKLNKFTTPTWVANYLCGTPSFPPDTLTNYGAWNFGATVGARGFITDSTVVAAGNFGAIITGGGANFVPAYFDGTNWRIG